MTCPECGADLSHQARFCRSCGLDLHRAARVEHSTWSAPAWAWGLVGVLVLAVLLGLASRPLRRLWLSLSGEPDRQGGPRAEELTSTVAAQLPGFLRLKTLVIQASDDVGDRAEPIFKSRFQGEAEVTVPTFRELAREGDVVFVAPYAKAGESRHVFGVAVSGLRGRTWASVIQFDSDPGTAFGRPRDLFGRRVIVAGSPEEADYRAEQRRQLELAQAAERERRAFADQAAREEAERQAEIARRQQEADRAAREQQLADQRAPIVKSVERRSYLLGELKPIGFGRDYSFRIRFTSFDPSTGNLGAVVDLAGVCEIRLDGMVANDNVLLRGVDFVRPAPDCSLGWTWRFSLARWPWRGRASPPGVTVPVLGGGDQRIEIQVQ